jgi:hypothetical protein
MTNPERTLATSAELVTAATNAALAFIVVGAPSPGPADPRRDAEMLGSTAVALQKSQHAHAMFCPR